VVKTYGYDVYGKVTSSSGSAPNEFDFAGQQTDPTGLQYLRARYYDSGTGTFLSREPMMAGPGWGGNPYGYASASPCALSDPTGLAPTAPRKPPKNCDKLKQKLQNIVYSLIRGARNFLDDSYGAKLTGGPDGTMWRHWNTYQNNQKGLTNVLKDLDDKNNGCGPGAGGIFRLVGEYLEGMSISALADKIGQEDAHGDSVWNKISNVAQSGWDGLVDALDEVEEGLKDWEPSDSPFAPPGPVPVPVPVP
jgi:RHS repeat-associated protein